MKPGDRVYISDETLSIRGQRGRIVRKDDLGWIYVCLDLHKGTVLQGQEYGPFIASELLVEREGRHEPESPR